MSLRILSGCFLVLYPLLVYLGLNRFDPRWIALLLIAMAGLRLIGDRPDSRLLWPWLAVALLAAGATFLTGTALGLLFYPVLVNAVLLSLFLLSCWRPPTIVERLARAREPQLPPEAVAYTRKVTLVWCVFFAGNGTVSALTIALGREWWTLYNGLVAYLLMAALMGGEYLVRRRVRERRFA